MLADLRDDTGIVSARHQTLYRALHRAVYRAHVVSIAFAASPVSPLAPSLAPSLASLRTTCLAPSRLSWRGSPLCRHQVAQILTFARPRNRLLRGCTSGTCILPFMVNTPGIKCYLLSRAPSQTLFRVQFRTLYRALLHALSLVLFWTPSRRCFERFLFVVSSASERYLE